MQPAWAGSVQPKTRGRMEVLSQGMGVTPDRRVRETRARRCGTPGGSGPAWRSGLREVPPEKGVPGAFLAQGRRRAGQTAGHWSQPTTAAVPAHVARLLALRAPWAYAAPRRGHPSPSGPLARWSGPLRALLGLSAPPRGMKRAPRGPCGPENSPEGARTVTDGGSVVCEVPRRPHGRSPRSRSRGAGEPAGRRCGPGRRRRRWTSERRGRR